MMASVVVGMMIPNSPANVGSFWFFLFKPLELYGVGATSLQATAAALGIWLIQLLQLLLFGGYFLLRGRVSMKTVWRTTAGSSTVKRPSVVRSVARGPPTLVAARSRSPRVLDDTWIRIPRRTAPPRAAHGEAAARFARRPAARQPR
jgi:hypothetical protein